MKKRILYITTLTVLASGFTGCAPDRINDSTERVFYTIKGKPYMLPVETKCTSRPNQNDEVICVTQDTYDKYSKFNDNGARVFSDLNELEKQELAIKIKPMTSNDANKMQNQQQMEDIQRNYNTYKTLNNMYKMGY